MCCKIQKCNQTCNNFNQKLKTLNTYYLIMNSTVFNLKLTIKSALGQSVFNFYMIPEFT